MILSLYGKRWFKENQYSGRFCVVMVFKNICKQRQGFYLLKLKAINYQFDHKRLYHCHVYGNSVNSFRAVSFKIASIENVNLELTTASKLCHKKNDFFSET